MDALDPKNELIDKYLREELTGDQLADFLRSMESDPELKKDVEFRKHIVAAIQEHGAANLKQFIRERTTRQQVIRVSYRAWYYAAAAVALILVASVVLLLKQGAVQNSETDFAALDSTFKDHQSEPVASADQVKKTKSTPQNARTDLEEYDDLPPVEGLDMAVSSAAGEASVDYPEAVIVASNIPVIPIKIESKLLEALVSETESVKTAKVAQRKQKTESGAVTFSDKKGVVDTFMAQNNTRTTEEKALLNKIEKFKLSFFETKDAAPMVLLTKSKNQESTEVVVYNLPYDNPLIFNYQNKYYLKTGKDYYELNMQKSGKQAVTPVTDPALLEALNQ